MITLIIRVEHGGCYFKFNKPFNQDEWPWISMIILDWDASMINL